MGDGLERAFVIGITLNLVFVAAEAGFGFYADSVALLADAGHNLSDVLGLGAAWAAVRLAKAAPSKRFTYGLKGSTILAALTNALLLLVAIGFVSRFILPARRLGRELDLAIERLTGWENQLLPDGT